MILFVCFFSLNRNFQGSLIELFILSLLFKEYRITDTKLNKPIICKIPNPT